MGTGGTQARADHVPLDRFADPRDVEGVDEGQGFDIASMEVLSPDSINTASLTHGRGLHMIRSAFDAVRFNEKGNQLLLVKYFSREA